MEFLLRFFSNVFHFEKREDTYISKENYFPDMRGIVI